MVLIQNPSRKATPEPTPEILQPIDEFYDPMAQQISNTIDDELKTEGVKRKEAKKKQVKVILLGQAESGKSTLQKQFQLCYSSQSLESERPSWRPVIYFNVIKAVRTILDEVDYHDDVTPQHLDAPSEQRPSSASGGSYAQISQLRSKLLPLVAIENSLASELNNGVSVSGGRTGVFMRAGWLQKAPGSEAPSSHTVVTLAARTLASVQDAIAELWQHPTVQDMMRRRKLRLDETASFFLDNIRHVAQPDYSPSIDDVLNARLQTLGVIEHSFNVELLGDKFSWLMYDVGGARGRRHAWVPYFDDATAVIFLAPISAFDQYLEEDPRVNRIHDSLQLFSSICSNKLLKNTHLVLLLNKTDLLKKKLQSGIEVRKYITSYGDRPNKYEHVSDYFRTHFAQAHQRKDISARTLFVHFTSMLDIKATQKIIGDVGEAIIRSHLFQTGLL